MVNSCARAGGVVAGKNQSQASAVLPRPGEILAELLGTKSERSPRTEWRAARHLVALGIPVIKIGREWRVPRSGVDAWLLSPACAAAAANAQQKSKRGPGRPSKAAQALRAAAASLQQGGAQ